MKVCILLAIVASVTAFSLPSARPTQAQIQTMITSAKTMLPSMNLSADLTKKMNDLLNHPNTQSLVVAHWNTLAASSSRMADEPESPAERCLLLLALLLQQLLASLTTTTTTTTTAAPAGR